MTHRLPALPRRLHRETSGVAMLEFAFSMPIVLMLGLYGVETANLALINLKVSQIALNLADNASRVGASNNLAQQQLREVDINDVLQATRLQGAPINLTTNARITVSSLENVQQAGDSAPVQRIHWQRCIGKKSGTGYDSSYGVSATSPTATYTVGATYDPNAAVDTDTSSNDNSASHPGSLAPNGMGDAGSQVVAPSGSAVIFVEINYQYQPIVGAWLLGTSKLHYIASFIVRDRRIYTEVYNPSPAQTRQTCNLYNT